MLLGLLDLEVKSLRSFKTSALCVCVRAWEGERERECSCPCERDGMVFSISSLYSYLSFVIAYTTTAAQLCKSLPCYK